MDKIYIFGHKNPDTDSVCGSIALSYLKNKMGLNTEVRILGTISKETEFVLKRFNFKTPQYLNDVKVQLKDVNYHKNYLINENKTIYETFNFMNKHGITGLPLTDNSKIFTGYVSLKEIVQDIVKNNNNVLKTSFNNIIDTLTVLDYVKVDDYIEGNVEISEDEIIRSNIIVTPNTKYALEFIKKEIKLLIITGNNKLSPGIKSLAKEKGVNVIATTDSLLKVSRIICLANPIKSIKRNQVTKTFNELDYLSDFNEETSKIKHTNYPIVNNKNVCLGMLRTIDAHEINQKKVILVDHNMLSQSVDGLYEAEILEIIDHHNLGDIFTKNPINFRSMSVGSVSTIIYYLFKENNIKIPKNIGGLLLSGIISDTLLLQSPTTTPIDKLVATSLAKLTNLNIKKFGLELLSSGVSINGLTPNEIIFKDFKTYKVEEHTMAIAQVFTTSINVYKPIIDDLVNELNRISDNHDYKVCTLFITDFLTNESYILYSSNSKRIIEMSYGIDNIYEGYKIDNIVSRKKQIVPIIMSTLEHIKE